MKGKHLKSALEDIARRAVPQDLNLWREIGPRLEQGIPRSARTRYKLSTSVAIVLAALLLAVTAAYAYYMFLESDAGLEGVNEQGLITILNASAVPTIYVTPPAIPPITKWRPEGNAPPATVIAQQVLDDAVVVVNWAYADESRLAVRFTITGLHLPGGLDYGYGAMGTFSVIDLNGNILGPEGFSTAAENRDDGSIVVTAIYYGHIDADKTPVLDLRMNVQVGGFDAPYVPPGSNSSPEMRNIPLLGSTGFNFSVPVHKGIEVAVDQTVEANGVKVRLESMIVNRSHTELLLCFDLPSKEDWQLWKTTIRIGDSDEILPSRASNAIAGNIRDAPSTNLSERCIELGYDAPHDGRSTVISVTVPSLVTSVPEFIPSERIELANRRLESSGIVFEYSGHDVKIMQQPLGMPDWEAYQLIWDAMADYYEGPWVFKVNIDP